MLTISCNRDSTFRGWNYMPDMYESPALETYYPSDLFEDSTSARQPVEGTIPRNFLAYQEFAPDAAGYEAAKAGLTMPKVIPTDSLALVHGQEIYSIFCDHCHGDKGDGIGILVEREKYLGVPSYADRDINLGTIFHVVTYGKGVMGSHASQVTPEERWKLAQYVMKLKSDLTGEDEPVETEEGEEESTEETQG